jgi:hypothetical protein
MPFKNYARTDFEPFVLPIVPRGVPISRSSSLDCGKTGKVPGIRRSDGWVGFHKWPQHVTTAQDLHEWATWYGDLACGEIIGLRLGDLIFIDSDADCQGAAEILTRPSNR